MRRTSSESLPSRQNNVTASNSKIGDSNRRSGIDNLNRNRIGRRRQLGVVDRQLEYEHAGDNRVVPLKHGFQQHQTHAGHDKNLLQDHGAYKGRQLLHPELTKRAVSNAMDRGYINGWRTAEGGVGRYEMSFWLHPHIRWFSCDVRIPTMSGFGGNYVSIMPNRTIGVRFADGHDDDPHTWNSYGIRNISDRVRPFCTDG